MKTPTSSPHGPAGRKGPLRCRLGRSCASRRRINRASSNDLRPAASPSSPRLSAAKLAASEDFKEGVAGLPLAKPQGPSPFKGKVRGRDDMNDGRPPGDHLGPEGSRRPPSLAHGPTASVDPGCEIAPAPASDQPPPGSMARRPSEHVHANWAGGPNGPRPWGPRARSMM